MSWTSLGLKVHIEGLPEPLERALCARWHKELTTVPELNVLLKTGSLPERPATAAQRVEVSGTATTAHVHGQSLWLGEGLFLHLYPNSVEVILKPAALREVDTLLAFAELHRLNGWLPLHAGTVTQTTTSQNTAALSFSGVSGAGKSTAVLRLMAQGFAVLAEDQTWFHPASGAVTGLDRFLRTYSDSLRRFAPQLQQAAQGQDQQGKLLLPLSPLPEAQLKHLFFLGAESLSAAERIRAVWECTGVPLLPQSRQRAMLAVNALLSKVTVGGVDRDQVLDVAERTLAP